jgi:hypothetical protein
MSMLVFWVVTPCGLQGTVHTNVSELHTVYIFRAENGGSVFLRNVGTVHRSRADPCGV